MGRSTAGSEAAESYCIDAFASNKTLIFEKADEYWPSVTELVTNLRTALWTDVHCNVYCTPPRSQGFGTHVDSHDTLILQTYGSKAWRLYEVDEPLPLESSLIADEAHALLDHGLPDSDHPERELALDAGDLLYLPRGVPHSAVSSEHASIHLTIGLYPLRRHQLLGQLVDLLACSDVDLRRRISLDIMAGKESLPSAGSLLRELASIADRLEEPVDPNRLARRSVESWADTGSAEGLIYSAINAKNVNRNTVVSRPKACRLTWRIVNGEIRLRCGKSMALPLKLERIMPFLEANASFRVGDLPDDISESAKVVLIRNLVKTGLLRIDSLGEKPPMSVRELEELFGT